ncbi:hypothetical protein ACHAWX_003609 [Stephanocyclus meneghinianus]
MPARTWLFWSNFRQINSPEIMAIVVEIVTSSARRINLRDFVGSANCLGVCVGVLSGLAPDDGGKASNLYPLSLADRLAAAFLIQDLTPRTPRNIPKRHNPA